LNNTATLTGNHVYHNTASASGGGLYASSLLSTTLDTNHVYSNTANIGGGLHLSQCPGLSLMDNEIYDNSGSFGGAAYLHSCDNATLSYNTVRGNTADSSGGGLHIYISDDVNLAGNTIYSNTANQYGGGIDLSTCLNASLVNNQVYSNTADDNGGGLHITNSPTATLASNHVYHNTAGSTGGGLHFRQGPGSLLISNDLHHNTAQSGGGASLFDSSDMTLKGNRIYDNASEGIGGGLRINNYTDLTLANNIVADNRLTSGSGNGAGVYINSSDVRLLHTTLAHNTGGAGSGIYVSAGMYEGRVVTLTNTILVSQTVGVYAKDSSTATLEATLWGTGTWANGQDTGGAGTVFSSTNIFGDPGFVDYANGDYHITGVSAARNAGVDAGVLDDVDGDSRLFAPPPDLGADEIVCLARVNDDPTEYTSVQAAVDAASDGDVVKVAGTCRGTQTRDGTAQVALVTQPLTIRGGYSSDFSTWDPATYPTTLDAQREGRVFRIQGDVHGTTALTLESLRITRGYISGASGGGIYSIYARTTISGCHIYENESSTTGGGAAFLYGREISLTNNHIYGNTAGNSAGGVYFSDCDDTLLTGNWVYENAASLESGIYIQDTSDVLLVNNVVADNQSGNSAGSGLRFDNADARVLHTTVARNHGGKMGIHVSDSSSVWLTNTIVVSHYTGIYVTSGSAATLANTLWGAGSWANEHNTGGKGTIVSSGSLSGDPSFVDYAGGDYHITAASDAFDQGIATWVSTDIDGHPRSVGAAPDMGADEVVPTLEIVKSGPARVNEGTPITYTLLITNTGAVASENVLLTDTLPGGASFVSASDGGSETGGVVSWPTFAVPPGIVTRTFTVTATDTITNDDYVATPQGELPAVGSVAVRTDINHAPVADAGAPQSVHTGTVTLDGSGSYDLDYGDQAYLWQQIDGPTAVAIDCPDCQTTFFDAPLLTGTYVFSFTDTDLYGLSDTDITTVTITNAAPMANAGTPQSVTVGTVTLDGSGSSDPESDAISFHWQQTGGPASVTLNDADTMVTTFTAPSTVGVYTFSLTVTDPFGADDDDTTTVTITLPDLTITKSGPSAVEPGELITYTLVVTNNGTAAATSLVITDALPSGATFVAASDGGSLMGNTVFWSVPSLDAGGVVTLTLTITAPETVTNDDYRVSCAQGSSAIGTIAITTNVTDNIYLPLVTR
jgi:uncharacterized repeat protein (TIGR01451 family)